VNGWSKWNKERLMKKPAATRITVALALILAIAMIAVGVLRQEHLVVLTKAVNICLECIGVG
jgi:hypothetical protein